ncbi:hypothetical protein ASG33_01825 [Dyadobacter sp. Leaf189]|nr:hypothetical protein ASG33_01825 [Dyadobacter sp. Leaf189]
MFNFKFFSNEFSTKITYWFGLGLHDDAEQLLERRCASGGAARSFYGGGFRSQSKSSWSCIAVKSRNSYR